MENTPPEAIPGPSDEFKRRVRVSADNRYATEMAYQHEMRETMPAEGRIDTPLLANERDFLAARRGEVAFGKSLYKTRTQRRAMKAAIEKRKELKAKKFARAEREKELEAAYPSMTFDSTIEELWLQAEAHFEERRRLAPIASSGGGPGSTGERIAIKGDGPGQDAALKAAAREAVAHNLKLRNVAQTECAKKDTVTDSCHHTGYTKFNSFARAFRSGRLSSKVKQLPMNNYEGFLISGLSSGGFKMPKHYRARLGRFSGGYECALHFAGRARIVCHCGQYRGNIELSKFPEEQCKCPVGQIAQGYGDDACVVTVEHDDATCAHNVWPVGLKDANWLARNYTAATAFARANWVPRYGTTARTAEGAPRQLAPRRIFSTLAKSPFALAMQVLMVMGSPNVVEVHPAQQLIPAIMAVMYSYNPIAREELCALLTRTTGYTRTVTPALSHWHSLIRAVQACRDVYGPVVQLDNIFDYDSYVYVDVSQVIAKAQVVHNATVAAVEQDMGYRDTPHIRLSERLITDAIAAYEEPQVTRDIFLDQLPFATDDEVEHIVEDYKEQHDLLVSGVVGDVADQDFHGFLEYMREQRIYYGHAQLRVLARECLPLEVLNLRQLRAAADDMYKIVKEKRVKEYSDAERVAQRKAANKYELSTQYAILRQPLPSSGPWDGVERYAETGEPIFCKNAYDETVVNVRGSAMYGDDRYAYTGKPVFCKNARGELVDKPSPVVKERVPARQHENRRFFFDGQTGTDYGYDG